MQSIIEVQHLNKNYYYGQHSQLKPVLSNVNLSVGGHDFSTV